MIGSRSALTIPVIILSSDCGLRQSVEGSHSRRAPSRFAHPGHERKDGLSPPFRRHPSPRLRFQCLWRRTCLCYRFLPAGECRVHRFRYLGGQTPLCCSGACVLSSPCLLTESGTQEIVLHFII